MRRKRERKGGEEGETEKDIKWVIVLIADIRFGFLRLSTIKKCPHMLKSDHRELRNSKVKFKWVARWVGGCMRGLQRQGWTLSIDIE